MNVFYYRDIFPIFFLIFARILGITLSSPIFSSSLIPPQYTVTIIFFIAVILVPFVGPVLMTDIPDTMIGYLMLAGNELFVGLAVGLFISVIFTVFQLAGELFSFQMGMGISSVLDPLSEIEVPVIGQIYSLFATFIFIAIDGITYEILVLRKSFDLIRIVSFAEKSGRIYEGTLLLFKDLFVLALQLAIPIIVTLLIINITLGIISKFAPQINIFMVGLNIEVIIGFLLIFLYIPFFSGISQTIFRNMFVNILKWLNVLGT